MIVNLTGQDVILVKPTDDIITRGEKRILDPRKLLREYILLEIPKGDVVLKESMVCGTLHYAGVEIPLFRVAIEDIPPPQPDTMYLVSPQTAMTYIRSRNDLLVVGPKVILPWGDTFGYLGLVYP